jgi:broad specificity phosphatase PhoE
MARRLGKRLGPFDLVVSSPLARCVETAVAMGFAVDEDYPELAGQDLRGETVPEVDDAHWEAGYAGFGRLYARGGTFADFANLQAEVWRAIACSIPDGGRGLVIGHGGFIEAGAVALFPDADHAAWGRAVRHGEGVLLRFENAACTELEILRVPGKLRKGKDADG